MLLKQNSFRRSTVGGNLEGRSWSEAYSSLHDGTSSHNQGSLNKPEAHDLQDCLKELLSICQPNVLFCSHSPSATSCYCVWQRLSSDQSLRHCSTERTNRRAGWPSLCQHRRLCVRGAGSAWLRWPISQDCCLLLSGQHSKGQRYPWVSFSW